MTGADANTAAPRSISSIPARFLIMEFGGQASFRFFRKTIPLASR